MQPHRSHHNTANQRQTLSIILAFVLNTLAFLPIAGADDYTVIGTIPVGSRSNSLGVNPETNRIYVSNLFDNNVPITTSG